MGNVGTRTYTAEISMGYLLLSSEKNMSLELPTLIIP